MTSVFNHPTPSITLLLRSPSESKKLMSQRQLKTSTLDTFFCARDLDSNKPCHFSPRKTASESVGHWRSNCRGWNKRYRTRKKSEVYKFLKLLFEKKCNPQVVFYHCLDSNPPVATPSLCQFKLLGTSRGLVIEAQVAYKTPGKNETPFISNVPKTNSQTVIKKNDMLMW